MDNAVRNAEKDAAALATERIALDRLCAQRAPLFDGRVTAEVRTTLDRTRAEAKASHHQAQQDWAKTASARSAAHSRVTMLAQAEASNSQALMTSVAARDERLLQLSLELTHVHDARAVGEAWLAEAVARQATLREAEAAARAVRAERARSHADHAAQGRPELDEPALDALLPGRSAALTEAGEALARVRQRLIDDNRNRDAAEATRALIATQRLRHDRWKAVADLIGSADGKKFRLFAQGLTLDRLLGLANLHLADLTPRYVLQRSPDSDLDLQVVDREMANEVRGVTNLSGGERFLVSLALALGLASMTSARTFAESLFIDEGFGALDAESLEVALSALETLHASGRKIGVISHVQAMVDRIGVQVRLSKLGGGRSTAEVVTV